MGKTIKASKTHEAALEAAFGPEPYFGVDHPAPGFWRPDEPDLAIVREAWKRDRNRRRRKVRDEKRRKAAKARAHHMRHRHSENRGGVPNPPPKPKARRSHVTQQERITARLLEMLAAKESGVTAERR